MINMETPMMKLINKINRLKVDGECSGEVKKHLDSVVSLIKYEFLYEEKNNTIEFAMSQVQPDNNPMDKLFELINIYNQTFKPTQHDEEKN
jgi:hypothetical protein